MARSPTGASSPFWNGLDRRPLEQRPETPVAAHVNLRGADYYKEVTTR